MPDLPSTRARAEQAGGGQQSDLPKTITTGQGGAEKVTRFVYTADEERLVQFDVFGAVVDGPSSELTRAGYTGHQHERDLGLIDMRGRMYDPLAARFLSADPVSQAPFWSQEFPPLLRKATSSQTAGAGQAARLCADWSVR